MRICEVAVALLLLFSIARGQDEETTTAASNSEPSSDAAAAPAANPEEEAEMKRLLKEINRLMAKKYNITEEQGEPDLSKREDYLTVEQAKMIINNLKQELKEPIDDVDVQGFAKFAGKWTFPINWAMKSGQYNSQDQKIIRDGVQKWQDTTCASFREQSPSSLRGPGILVGKNGNGCSSYIGFVNKGVQDISLDNGCVHADYVGIVSHEFGHALGMNHEQNRPDRDKFVSINFNLIKSDMAHNFRLDPQDENYDTPYDFDSVMHYDTTSFTTQKGAATITRRDGGDNSKMGQRKGPSFLDIKRMNIHYDCVKKNCGDKASSITCSNGGYVNPKTCNSCNCPPEYPKCQGGGGSPSGGDGGDGGDGDENNRGNGGRPSGGNGGRPSGGNGGRPWGSGGSPSGGNGGRPYGRGDPDEDGGEDEDAYETTRKTTTRRRTTTTESDEWR